MLDWPFRRHGGSGGLEGIIPPSLKKPVDPRSACQLASTRCSLLALPHELLDTVCNHPLVDLHLHVKRTHVVKDDQIYQSESSSISNLNEWATLFALRRTSQLCKKLIDDSLHRAKGQGRIAVVVDGTDPENNGIARIDITKPSTPRALQLLLSSFCVYEIILPISIATPRAGCVKRSQVTAKRATPLAPFHERTFSWTTIRGAQDPDGVSFTPAFRAIEDKIRRILFTTLMFKCNDGSDAERLNAWIFGFHQMMCYILSIKYSLPHHPKLRIAEIERAQRDYRVAVLGRVNAEECARVARERVCGGDVEGQG